MKILAAHQPNFIPPFPYFLKMALCDIFVLQSEVQFSKSGFQNYQEIFGKRWTSPVKGGDVLIKNKFYVTGERLAFVNEDWIRAIAGTMGISTTKIAHDIPSKLHKTERLIELCKIYGCDAYLTNPSAVDKYLDIDLLEENGIQMLPLETNEKRNVLDLFNDLGIEKTVELLNREVKRIKKLFSQKIKVKSGV